MVRAPVGQVPRQVFRIVLIKPSHYDADGYVIQWWRSTIPSNSLASVYGLLSECAAERLLGPDVDIEIDAFDECNTVIDVKRIVTQIRVTGGGFVGLVGAGWDRQAALHRGARADQLEPARQVRYSKL